MYVTEENYQEYALCRLSQNGINYKRKSFTYLEFNEATIFELSEKRKIFQHPNSETGVLSTWCNAYTTGSNKEDANFCISHTSHTDTPGYFLEYLEVYDIYSIISNLDKLAGKLKK